MGEVQSVPQPPEPPTVARAFQMKTTQVVAILLLAGFLLLAALGSFGDRKASVTAASESLSIEVTYPALFRYGMSSTLEAEVANTGEVPLRLVTLAFDRAYLERFSGVSFTPDVARVDADSFLVELADMAPGERRAVTVALDGDAPWRHSGSVEGSSSEGARARVEVSTLVFP